MDRIGLWRESTNPGNRVVAEGLMQEIPQAIYQDGVLAPLVIGADSVDTLLSNRPASVCEHDEHKDFRHGLVNVLVAERLSLHGKGGVWPDLLVPVTAFIGPCNQRILTTFPRNHAFHLLSGMQRSDEGFR